MLMGYYLICIAVQDYRYRGRYHSFAMKWVASWSCTIIGIIAMISSEVSLMILTFISIERFLLIARPFGYKLRLNRKSVLLTILMIWIVGMLIAVLPGT